MTSGTKGRAAVGSNARPVFRWGLIGCGNIAVRAHLPAMAQLRDRVRLVAAADVNEASANAAAQPWGADAYTDYRQLLQRGDVDGVLIATPEFLHRDQVLAAAANRKHVLVEKPMAMSVAEADDMVAACHTANVRFMVGHSRRFAERYLTVRRAIDAGDVGSVRLVRENERRVIDETGYWAEGHWSSDPARSRGVTMSNAIHEVDLLRWYVGAEPVAVYAEAKATLGSRRVPDFLSCSIRFSNGGLAATEIVSCLPAGYPSSHELEVYGTGGAIRSIDHDAISIYSYRKTSATFPTSPELFQKNQTAYIREQAAFVEAVVTGHPLPMAPEEARWALALALAADRSAETGSVVQL